MNNFIYKILPSVLIIMVGGLVWYAFAISHGEEHIHYFLRILLGITGTVAIIAGVYTLWEDFIKP